MAAGNIRSIEQLKNIRLREAGLVLGVRRIASKPIIWEWVYSPAQLQVSKRASGLAWTGDMNMSTQECAQAILHRWGASENTFKYLNHRHPVHYHPGFKLVESDRQDIANPEIKRQTSRISAMKTELNKLLKKLAKAKAATKKGWLFPFK